MEKKLEAFGVAAESFDSLIKAIVFTYTDSDFQAYPTPLVFKENPFNDLVLKAKNILEIGGGVGRNVPWILGQTSANYHTVEPNPSMKKYFHEYTASMQKDRIFFHDNFETLDPDMKFDVVISTFVFQHIGFRPSNSQMNITDITQAALKKTADHGIWIMIEHEKEEPGWIPRWSNENNIFPDVYIQNWTIPGRCSVDFLTHRGSHDLIIFKKS